MRGSLRFHAIAVAAISTVIIAVFYLTQPSSAEKKTIDPDQFSERAVEIYSATWGMNCNPYIEEAIRRQAATPAPADASGSSKPAKPLQDVTTNNVLDVVSGLCNGRVRCDLTATAEAMGGLDPLGSCYKQLDVSYRCFTYDQLWNVTVEQGKTLRLDCNAQALKHQGK